MLTFFGSVLLFVGSLIVLQRTNDAADRRTAEDRQNERQRDYRLFQRDTLLRIGDEVVEAAIETWDQFVTIRNSPAPLRDEPFKEIAVWGRKIAGNVVRLSLIGAHETSQRCIELRDAVNNPELQQTILDLDVVERTTIGAQLHGKEAERLARQQELRSKFEELMEGLNDARKAFSDSVERELARTNQPPR
ncbi:hypothetical protein AWB95_16490 [Mycobacterium celatum]|uniref:Uncharacterized protein n=1 Tax=Mycobacterium celatum TaxID=28045 RepID=A0A1X1RMH7_MYCCE|nr:hypothetical protein AWB95_16490 [Mycobacterium celatum]PIB79640.1 hypothetical protein CQY23_06900 [Mycobacterium celatum]